MAVKVNIFLPSPSGKVSLKATEGDNKSPLRFALRFLSPIVKISLMLDFATFPEGESKIFCVVKLYDFSIKVKTAETLSVSQKISILSRRL